MLHNPIGDEHTRYQTDAVHLPFVPALVCNAEGKIIEANEAISNLLSFSQKELVGLQLSELSYAVDQLQESCLNHCLANYSITEYSIKRNFTGNQGRLISTLINVRGVYNAQKELVKTVLSITRVLQSSGFDLPQGESFSENMRLHREELFASFVSSIGHTLGVNAVMIAQITEESRFSKVKMFWENGRVYKDFIYDNLLTPCHKTLEKKGIHFMNQVSYYHPHHQFLKERVYNWYVGIPVTNLLGIAIGHLSIYNRKALPDPKIVRSFLYSIIGQVGVELERAIHEKAFHEIEKKYKLIFDHSTDAILLYNPIKNNITNYNKRALTLLNRSQEELGQSKSILDFSPEKQADGVSSELAYEQKLLKVFKEGKAQKINWRFKKPDESTVDVNINLTPYQEDIRGGVWMLILQKQNRFRIEREETLHKIGESNLSKKAEQLQNELDYQNRKLSSNLMLSSRLTELLYSIKEALQKLGPEVSHQARRQIDQMLREIDRNIDLDEEWRKFKWHFEEVHPEFFTKLLNRFPTLSPRQLRHCAYIHLGLSSKEAAKLLNVAPKSIEMARYRLKKKMNLDKHDRLSEFIQSI